MRQNIFQLLRGFLITVAGCALTGFAVATILTPNKVVAGGATGIATILYHAFHTPQGISIAAVNGILLLSCLWVLGKAFVIRTILGAGLISLFVQLFSYLPPVTDNIILATLFGGVLYGLGVGLPLSEQYSTGGMDILGRMIQHFFPQLRVGKILQGINLIIITASYIVFRDTELILFSFLALFFETFAIDWLIMRLNVSRIAFVITDKGEAISKELIHTSRRGVTIINAVGAYHLSDREMLFCALKKSEIPAFQKKVLKIDEKAFIVYAESTEIKGNGFRLYH